MNIVNQLLDTRNIDKPLIIFFIITVLLIIQTGKHLIILELFNKKEYFRNLIIMVIIIGSVLIINKYSNLENSKKSKLIDALKKSIIAFIIAFFAKIDLIFAPFYLVFIFAYYSSGWT